MSAGRLIILGVDGVSLEWLEEMNSKHKCAALARLLDGACIEAVSSLPLEGAVNWNTLATGAPPGVHGVVSSSVKLPGGRLDERASGYDSRFRKAESLWEACARQGVRTALLDWPCSHRAPEGVECVAGSGDPDSSPFAIAPAAVYSGAERKSPARWGVTWCEGAKCPSGERIELSPAFGWFGLPGKPEERPKEAEAVVRPPSGEADRFFILSLHGGEDEGGGGYGEAIISPEKDASTAWARLRPGEWSDWIEAHLETASGPERGSFRLKLVSIASDGLPVLYRTPVWPRAGGGGLASSMGPAHALAGAEFAAQWLGEEEAGEILLEAIRTNASRLEKGLAEAVARGFRLVMLGFPGLDVLAHVLCRAPCREDPPDPALWEGARARALEALDSLIAGALDAAGADGTVALVSDHGFTPLRREPYDINRLLADNGLLSRSEGGLVEWSKTRAFAVGCHAYVNLKERELTGTVPPDEYEGVVSSLSRVLDGLRPRRRGSERYMQLVVRKEEADALGLWGEDVGDVVFFARAQVVGGHRSCFNSAERLRATVALWGRGARRDVRPARPVRLEDAAPTLSALLGVDPPAQAEGRVLRELLD